MNAVLRSAYERELAAARDSFPAFHHLERAHILSQPMALLHVRTHVAMLAAGVRRHDRREIVGQLLRLVLAGPGSLTGRYPVGNTGSADVGAMTPMPIPADLMALLPHVDPTEQQS
jgi:hypothetical protein